MNPAFLAFPKAASSAFASPDRDRRRWSSSPSGASSTTAGSAAALYAVGGNPVAARYCGIDLARTTILRAILSPARSRACAAISGSRVTASPIPTSRQGYELTIIAACVIGGVSIAGGVGSVPGALLGALFLGVVVNALPVINVSPFWQMLISGAVILAAVVVNARSERRDGKLILRGARRLPAQPRSPGMSVSNPALAPAMKSPTARRAGSPTILLRWESILVVLLIGVIVVNASISPYFLDFYNLLDATFNFSEKAILALAMALLIIVRDIDLSIAAIVALASLAMGLAAQAGAPTPALMVSALGVGVALRRLQRRAGHRLCAAVDRRHHRHHVAVSRHRPGGARRSGADQISRPRSGDRPGLYLATVADPDLLRAVPRCSRRCSASCCIAR